MPANETRTTRTTTSDQPLPRSRSGEMERQILRCLLILIFFGSVPAAILHDPLIGSICATVALAGLACSCQPIR
jgi:hypothetical protein